MRDPSIHIKLSTLKALFKEFSVSVDPLSFWMRAYEQRVTNRTPALAGKQSNDSATVKLFSRVLNAVRTELRHKGITDIERGSKQYPMLVEVSELASNFCLANDLPLDKGLKIFCEIGIECMKRVYGINKFKYHLDEIYRLYAAYSEFDNLHPDNKRQISSLIRWFVERTKMYQFEEDFKTAKYLVDWMGIYTDTQTCQAKLKHYFDFQFDWFISFADSTPAPSVLHGKDNIMRYLHKHPIKGESDRKDEAFEQYEAELKKRKQQNNEETKSN